MSRIAAFLLAVAACAPALAQEPARTEAAQQRTQSTEDEEPQADAGRRRLAVTWQAPEPLAALFRQHLPPPRPEAGERRAGSIRPWVRDIRRRVPEIAASEGYFSTTVEVRFEGENRERAIVVVEPGPRTKVGEVDIRFAGDLAGEGEERQARRQQIRDAWALKPGAAFRSDDWEVAKTRLLEDLVDRDYAAGELADSEARVDAEAARARLTLVLDSGPRFTLGDIEIHGIDKYSEAVVRRSVDLRRGERYSLARLTELQRTLQDGPWFSSVVVDVPRDRSQPQMVPVHLTVTERPRREVGLALGYGTDDGARTELAYRHRDLFDRGFDLQSSLRISQKRQIGYADVYLPPGLFGSRARGSIPFKDSVGVLTERSTFEKLDLTRFAVAGYRHFKLDNFETRVGLSYQIERSRPEGADERIKRALAPIVAATWRHVDNIFDPQRGGVLNLQLAAGAKAIASGDDFIRIYGQYQHWIPITPRDQILLRTEIGRNFTDSRERIPEDFLFRAGGSRSNRGYAFQSLGVEEGEAVVGGRYMATASVEYVHWLTEKWGGAVFLDVGDAKDNTRDWRPHQSYGVGARFKTPAGPFALDLAYAEEARHFRLAFSVTVAF